MQSSDRTEHATHPAGADDEPEGQGDEVEQPHLPPQSIWPMTVAGGVALGMGGLVTTPYVSVLGLLLMFFGLYMWVQELRHEPH